MVKKRSMVEEIGEEEILLPDLVNAALAANDQIKYYLALLQSAQQRAEHPRGRFSSMTEERELVQEDDARLDTVIAGSIKQEDRLYAIPHTSMILDAIRGRLERMLRPFRAMADGEGREFQERADRLLRDLPAHPGTVTAEQIQALTSGDRQGPDSVHLLVMDLHRALNALQSTIAEEEIEGAQTYRLADEDRELVASFMDGLNRTARLKFEHPGLGTTATRSGDRLAIQNDVGETEAHLMMINVAGLEVSVVQTDVHLPRVLFFQGLFRDYGVQWQDTISRTAAGGADKGLYHLSRGTFAARDRDQLKAFLNFLGAKIVFLIDWNRARKRLQIFLPKRDAVSVLRWAAENEVGHRGFLELGGDQLVFEALELAPRVPLRYGQPLYQVLGRDRTAEFFRSALRKSTLELLARKPARLVRDEIKADLLKYFRPVPQDLMTLSIRHATLIFEVSSTLRAAVHGLEEDGEPSRVERDAGRSKRWEKGADDIVSRVRTLAKTIEAAAPFVELAVMADDAIDYLEEAMYLMTLIGPETPASVPVAELGTMTDIAAASCQEFIKSLYAAEHAYGRWAVDDMASFLRPVDAVIGLEEECDLALRRTMAAIYSRPAEVKGTVLAMELARNIEESTNSLMKAAYILKENVFGNAGAFEVR